MASINRGQPPACQQKVVHRTQVHKGTGKPSKSGHRGNDGWQLKPSGSCQPDETAKATSVRRKEIRMATWNVTGARNREVELEDAMKAYKIGVLGLSETWLKKGEELVIPGYIWTGVAGEKASGKGGGVGFLVREDVWNTVGEVIEVSSRILGLFVKVGKKDIWMFQVYAPVNDATKGEKEKFWKDLRDVIETKRRSAQIVVLGDLNGRVGTRQEDWEIVGRYGEEVVNENGESFLELCRGGDMVIMNGWFPHKQVHKMTFVQRMVTQRDREAILDYFCVSKELKKFVVDVKVKRGVEIGSYHHLVLMRMDEGRMGVKGKKWKRNRYRLCIEKLKREECRSMYTTKLEEYLMTEEGQSIEEEWIKVKGGIMQAAEESLGRKKCGGRGKKWWNKAIEELVHRKKDAYRKWLNSRTAEHKKEYRELSRKV